MPKITDTLKKIYAKSDKKDNLIDELNEKIDELKKDNKKLRRENEKIEGLQKKVKELDEKNKELKEEPIYMKKMICHHKECGKITCWIPKNCSFFPDKVICEFCFANNDIYKSDDDEDNASNSDSDSDTSLYQF